MTQPDLFEPVKVPKAGTQHHKLLLAFQRGERLTIWNAMTEYGCGALHQRCGELKRNGWPIQRREIKTESGARVAEFWMEVGNGGC